MEKISESLLFIGHDSMVAHMASLASTKSIVMPLGTVRPHETSPYQTNAIIVAPRIDCFPCNVETTCELLPCHSKIQYDVVLELINCQINNGKKSLLPNNIRY